MDYGFVYVELIILILYIIVVDIFFIIDLFVYLIDIGIF